MIDWEARIKLTFRKNDFIRSKNIFKDANLFKMIKEIVQNQKIGKMSIFLKWYQEKTRSKNIFNDQIYSE